jgi:hypothetical protein
MFVSSGKFMNDRLLVVVHLGDGVGVVTAGRGVELAELAGDGVGVLVEADRRVARVRSGTSASKSA